jgi:8-oxo-dGTP diphosphatase
LKESCHIFQLPDNARSVHQHQGGKWEFPGGKVEQTETVQQALARELQEEIGINVKAAQPLLVIEHSYSDKAVKLDVWLVTEFTGTAQSLEGLENRWVQLDELEQLDFPEANRPIIDVLRQGTDSII